MLLKKIPHFKHGFRHMSTIGYKGFDKDLKGFSNFQYKVGETYELTSGQLQLCRNGFHFCPIKPIDVLKYYNDANSKYAIIEAQGAIIDQYAQAVTDKIKIVEIILKDDLFKLTTGKYDTLYGRQEWYREGVLHREDGPAIIYESGAQKWYKFGKCHREDGPALILSAGIQEWHKAGEIHREDGPAIIHPNGNQFWYLLGKLHRKDGPAIILSNGDQFWYHEGQLHRKDGPARILSDGTQEWYLFGKCHREDGPAVIWSHGSQYWYRGEKFIEKMVQP